MLLEKDKSIIRELAKKYMDLALSEKQLEMNKRMQATNDLKLVRPVVLMDEIPWYQMNIDGELDLCCEDPRLHGLEHYFRTSLYRRKYFKCDTILDPVFKVRKAYDSSGIGIDSNKESSAEQIKGDFVYARKPNPANVAIKTDPEVIRIETEKTVKACQKHGCPLEFVLKDISTVSGKPENLIVWAKTVSDVLDYYYGK